MSKLIFMFIVKDLDGDDSLSLRCLRMQFSRVVLASIRDGLIEQELELEEEAEPLLTILFTPSSKPKDISNSYSNSNP